MYPLSFLSNGKFSNSDHAFSLQMVQALRYLHKEKGIVHRDLTPKNIMLGENDKVTISKYINVSYTSGHFKCENYVKGIIEPLHVISNNVAF